MTKRYNLKKQNKTGQRWKYISEDKLKVYMCFRFYYCGILSALFYCDVEFPEKLWLSHVNHALKFKKTAELFISNIKK